MENKCKCRFWHKTSKQMHYDVNGLYKIFVKVGDNQLFAQARGHLMQCTGIQDIKVQSCKAIDNDEIIANPAPPPDYG